MVYLLLSDLRVFLEARLRLPLLTPAKPQDLIRAPQIFIGALPPKKAAAPDEHPCIVIRAMGGQDAHEEAVVIVRLLCGVYNAESPEALEHDLVNLVMACRREILAARAVGAHFALEADERERLLWWQKPEDQPAPYAWAEIVTRWRMPGLSHQLATSQEVETYGSGYL